MTDPAQNGGPGRQNMIAVPAADYDELQRLRGEVRAYRNLLPAPVALVGGLRSRAIDLLQYAAQQYGTDDLIEHRKALGVCAQELRAMLNGEPSVLPDISEGEEP